LRWSRASRRPPGPSGCSPPAPRRWCCSTDPAAWPSSRHDLSRWSPCLSSTSWRCPRTPSRRRRRRETVRQASATRRWDVGTWRRSSRPRLLVEEVVDLALRLVLRAAIALLDLPGEDLRVAVNLVEVVVGELAPLLADPTLELLPLTLESFTVHEPASSLRPVGRQDPNARVVPSRFRRVRQRFSRAAIAYDVVSCRPAVVLHAAGARCALHILAGTVLAPSDAHASRGRNVRLHSPPA